MLTPLSFSPLAFASCEQDALTSVVYHVATLMPTPKDKTQVVGKLRYIGNDHVALVSKGLALG